MAAIPVHNPTVPFLGTIPGGFRHGLMIRVKGHMHSMADRFVVNLMCGPALNPLDDVALHLSVRPNEGDIVRNSYRDGWENEERHGGCPIYPGTAYEILILATHSSYKIAINGNHHSEFTHRLPLSRVAFINVSGNTSVSFIGIEEDPSSRSGYAPSAPVPSAPMVAVNQSPVQTASSMSRPMGMGMPMPMSTPMSMSMPHQGQPHYMQSGQPHYAPPSGQPHYAPPSGHQPYVPPSGPPYAQPPAYTPPNPMAQPMQNQYNPQSASFSYNTNSAPYPQGQYGGGMATSVHTTPGYSAPPMMNQPFMPKFSGKKER
uniref:Galectin n=1 Tax=Tabanus bromius TaxID=304241 RepID=A0A0K8TRL3_TABBR